MSERTVDSETTRVTGGPSPTLTSGPPVPVFFCSSCSHSQVKTQLQLDPRLKGPLHAARVTVAERGFFGLYRGLSSLLIGSIPKAAVRFWAYEECRKMLMDENGKMSAGRSFAAGLGTRPPPPDAPSTRPPRLF